MRSAFLPFSPPSIGDDEVAEVVEALRSGWITTGPRVKRFEEEFASFIGAEAALAVFSCTDAMQVGLAALGLGPGDEVITSTLTFCSTAHVVEHLGARPVLVDVEPETLTLDPEQVRSAITPRTRAILPVHVFGHPAMMDELLAIGSQHGVPVVEDAAHALPARYKGRLIGTIGTWTAFSFYATKNLTTAEGGMLTGPRDLIERARPWALHGMNRDAYKRYSAEGSWFYEVVVPGFKCNMTDIQAAIGLSQLRRLPEFQRRRREIVANYGEKLGRLGVFDLPVEREHVEHAWHLYPVRLRDSVLSIGRDRFISELLARNIGTSVHFIPVHLHSFYRDKYGYRPKDFPTALAAYERLVSLPLHPGLSDADVEDVVEAIADIVDLFRLRA